MRSAKKKAKVSSADAKGRSTKAGRARAKGRGPGRPRPSEELEALAKESEHALREQIRRLHDLSRLAVTALRHLFGDPGFLQRMTVVRRQAFDRGHGFSGHQRHGRDAGAH